MSKATIPIITFKLGFTTFSHSESPAPVAELNIIPVPLADSPLGITRSITHEVVRPPPSLHPFSNDPQLAWEANGRP